jgi:hypothetical protein
MNAQQEKRERDGLEGVEIAIDAEATKISTKIKKPVGKSAKEVTVPGQADAKEKAQPQNNGVETVGRKKPVAKSTKKPAVAKPTKKTEAPAKPKIAAKPKAEVKPKAASRPKKATSPKKNTAPKIKIISNAQIKGLENGTESFVEVPVSHEM